MTVRSYFAARPAIFLDKDGTLLEDVPFNVSPGLMHLREGVAAALTRLGKLGLPLVIVSNQSGIARGYFTEAAMGPVRRRLGQLFACSDATLAGFYYCPHHPGGDLPSYAIDCDCRKPMPGMFHRAARELGLALSDSWMIGDFLDDIAAAKRAGCRAILLNNGGETEWKLDEPARRPDYLVDSIAEAIETIIAARYAELGLRVF